jgi:hypothetical protein
MARGDLISVQSFWGVLPYRHFGIDLGDGHVIHLAATSGVREMRVQQVTAIEFANKQPIRIETVEECLEPDEVVRRAEQSVGRVGYHLAFGNCEHFAHECKTGKSISHQSDRIICGTLRTACAGSIAVSTKVVSSAVASGLPRAILSRASGIASLVGELARQSVYAASRQCAIEHSKADLIGTTAGTITAGIVGGAAGGPLGGLSSAAMYLSIDHLTDQFWRKCVTGSIPAEEQGPYRKSSGSDAAVPEY